MKKHISCNYCRRYIVLLFLLIWCSTNHLFANTPEGTVTTLIKAMKDYDPGLWYSRLSKTDVDSLHEMIGEYQKQEFERDRTYQEKELGKTFRDIYEYKGGELALILRPYSKDKGQQNILDLFFIKDISIWADKYAEVTVFLPIMIRGVLPPIRLSMVKENGTWKFCQALSSTYFINGRNSNFDVFVSMYLDLFMGIRLDRADTSKMRRKEFRLPPEQSDKYFTTWKNITNITAKDFLAIWILTGDKKALETWEKEKSSGNKTLTDKEIEVYKGFLSGNLSGRQPSAQQRAAITNSDAEKYFLYVKSAFFRDILAYKKFVSKFSDDEVWRAKAKYQIAENYEYGRNYQAAEKAYIDFLNQYPKAEDSVKAQVNLAKLYWDKLGKQSDAAKIWKELDAIGKLPADVPYRTGGIVPKTLVQNLEVGYLRGIVDFDVNPDGKWIDVLYNSGSERIGNKEYSPLNNILVRYQENGNHKDLFKKKIEQGSQDAWNHSSYRRMQTVNNGIWLYTEGCNGHALFLSPQGEPLKRFRDEGEVLAELPIDGKEGLYGWEKTGGYWSHSPFWQGVHFGSDSIYVYAGNNLAIKQFDTKTKKMTSKTIPATEVRLGNSNARMAPSENGRMFVVSPESGEVLEYNKEGKVANTLKDVLPGVQFKSIRDFVFDKEGTLYAALGQNHQIAIYSKDGVLINSFFDDSIIPVSIAVDGGGNIFVLGYAVSGGGMVKVYDRSGNTKTSFKTLEPKANTNNEGIKDLAVLDDGFVYVRVDTVVERYNMKGERVDDWIIPNYGRETGVLFAADQKRKRLYVLYNLAVYEYDGPKTKKIADLQLPAKPYLPAKVITAFSADRRGYLRGYIAYSGTFSFNPDQINGSTVYLSTSGAKYGSQVSPGLAEFDKDGNIWFCNFNDYGKVPTIERYDSAGKETLRIQEASGSRSLWKPGDIVRNGKDELYIADSANQRIAKYNIGGTYLGDFDMKKYISGGIQRIRVDSKGRLYTLIREMNKQSVLRFDGDLFNH